MYAVESLVLRVSIVLCMVAAVVTILYFSPLPNKYAKSCDRTCHEYDWPMICRYKFTIETFLKDSSCDSCFENATSCDNKCITGDGKPRGLLAINQQLPGPTIHVCRNDIVMVDVTNKIPSQSIAVHFRGQLQEESPYMDGTPMITQCPINSYTTFQYKFRASVVGTHFYSAHSSSLTSDGIFGGFVVREDIRFTTDKKFYDVDDKNHLILISEWSKILATDIMDDVDTPDKILINGRSSGTDQPIFHVLKGKRYRFRVAYTGGVTGCPVSLNVDKHFLKIIALDGQSITPHEADSIILNKGERVDFVFKAKELIGDYALNVKATCFEGVIGEAIIRYDEYAEKGSAKREFIESNIKREFNTGICEDTTGKVCLNELHSQKKISNFLRQETVEKQIFLGYNYTVYKQEVKDKLIYNRRKLYTVNNITFVYPPSPLLTQYFDVSDSLLCNSEKVPMKCRIGDICECVHVENIPLGAAVELILFDQGGDMLENIFHLHGYHFYVVASRKFDKSISTEEIKSLDRESILFKRNFVNPPMKDIIRLPKYGAVALRFLANNPGYWILRDENSNQWTRGMDVILKVGESRNFPAPPSSFPTCGSWIGPEYFLG